MATSEEFIEYASAAAARGGEWDVRYRKMFGEYMVYINDKPLLLVCDSTVYVKKLPCVSELLKNAPCGAPYEGAKEHFILDMDDEELCGAVIAELERATPLPVPKKKKTE